MQERDIYKTIEYDILHSKLEEHEKNMMLSKVLALKHKKINLLITGATGCGKSSTINAMFDTEVAKVGVGVDPETMDISKYELRNLTLWDSPGLGDGKEADIRHSKNIIAKLNELDEDNKPLIDLVLVILDGGSRDLGTSFELITQVIIPALGESAKDRILVAINQCDVAMKGRNWNFHENRPEPPLIDFLNEKVESVRRRIKEATGVDTEPIYYSAGYTDGTEKQNPYNLSKLLYFIVKNTPEEKRLLYINNISEDKEMWKDSDELKNYSHEIQESMLGVIANYIGKGVEKVAEFVGGTISAITSVVSTVGSAIASFFSGW